MVTSKFKDYKGNSQIQYDREESDTDADMEKVIKYPNKLSLANSLSLGFFTLKEFEKRYALRYQIASVVNYSDIGYTSIYLEERKV